MNEPASRDWDLTAYLRIRRIRDTLLEPISSGIADTGVSANLVSLLGVSFAASLYWSLERSALLAGAGFLAALACDALDGAVARRRGSSSATGKLVDHACDTSTFLLVLAAIDRCGLAQRPLLSTAAGLAIPLLVVAIYHRRVRSSASFGEPAGGLFAHLFKVPVYLALLIYVSGGDNLIGSALWVANSVAVGSLLLLLVSLALAALPRLDQPPASGADATRSSNRS